MFIEIKPNKAGRAANHDLSILGHSKNPNKNYRAHFSKKFMLGNHINRTLNVKIFMDNETLLFKFNQDSGFKFNKEKASTINLNKIFSKTTGTYNLEKYTGEEITDSFIAIKIK